MLQLHPLKTSQLECILMTRNLQLQIQEKLMLENRLTEFLGKKLI